MPAPSLPEVLALLRVTLEQNFPGFVPGDMTVRSLDGCRKLQLPLPSGGVPPATRQPGSQAPARHSSDFRSVHWFGTDCTFTGTQAAVVRLLWEAWEDGTPEVSQATLLEAADSSTERLRDLFRDSLAWGTMIVPGAHRGTFQLVAP